MQPQINYSLMTIIFLIVLVITQNAAANQVYRWIDKDGNVFYSDKVPPTQSQYKRSKIDKRGMAVKVFDGAKSFNQIKREKKLKKLRKEKERLMEEQRANDRALLRSFRNQQEIRDTLNSKLTTIGSLIGITNSNIGKLENQLAKQEERAASRERNGKKIPKKLLNQIGESRDSLRRNYKKLSEYEKEKTRLTRKYENDITRFGELVANTEDAKPSIHRQNRTQTGINEVDGISIYKCRDENACKAAWQLALNYVEEKATTPISIKNEKIIYTADPAADHDIGLAVYKLPGESTNYANLFLDIRCKSTSLGQDLCASNRIKDIRKGFNSFISERLKQ